MINRDDTLIYIKEYNSSLLGFFYKVGITLYSNTLSSEYNALVIRETSFVV
jgi:hypothetical protein